MLQTSNPSDPLAALRIDRSGRRPPGSGWFGKVVGIGVLLGLIAVGRWAWNTFGDELTRLEVKAASVEMRTSGDADSVLSAQGYLKSEKQAAIGAKVPGRVLKIYVKEGQAVNSGAVLAELEHADVDETLAAMKASLDAMGDSAEAVARGLDKAKADQAEIDTALAQDERDFIRAENLHKDRKLSRAEYETADSKRKVTRSRRDSMLAGVALAQAKLREAEAQRRASDARFREAEQQRQNLFVRAPFKGIVISKEAEEGESIMPGGMGAASGRGSVVTLADLLHLEVETDVKEDYVSRVKKDQRVSVSVDAVPNRRFGGKVRTIIPMGDRAKGTVKVKVQLDVAEVREVNNPETESFTLFPEMAATVHFMGEGKAAASGAAVPQFFAPAAAVESDGDGRFVWQIVDERVKRARIETGDLRDGKYLIAKGLKGGERVVLDPPKNLKDEMRVKVAP